MFCFVENQKLMLKFKSLENTEFTKIHAVFVNAFSNYQEPFDLTEKELKYMLERRGCDLQLSYGAFYDNSLIGFVLNAIGNWNGFHTAYDTGTGIIKEFQGKGIAKDLFGFTIKELKKHNIKQYLLEVIKTNTKAIQLYEKIGFQINEVYDYYIFQKSELTIKNPKNSLNISFEVLKNNVFEECGLFCDTLPSWQNTKLSIQRKQDSFAVLQASIDDMVIGYGIIEKHTGDIPQLAIHPDYRRKGAGTKLLYELIGCSESEQIKIINIQSDYEPFKEWFKSLQILPGKGQYEMILEL